MNLEYFTIDSAPLVSGSTTTTLQSPEEPSPSVSFDQLIATDNVFEKYPDFRKGPADLWNPVVDKAFHEALELYPNPTIKMKVSGAYNNKAYGRNELISRYIYYKTGEFRSRKQVGGRLRRIKKNQKKNAAAAAASIMEDNDKSMQNIPSVTLDKGNGVFISNNLGLDSSVEPSDCCSTDSPKSSRRNSGMTVDTIKETGQRMNDGSGIYKSDDSSYVNNSSQYSNTKMFDNLVAPWFSPKCVVHSMKADNSVKLAHVSAPFYEKTAQKTPFCRYISIFQFNQSSTVDLISSIVSFGLPLLKYHQTFTTEYDRQTDKYYIMADNAPIDNFLEFFCEDTAQIEDEECKRIIINNLMISQTVILQPCNSYGNALDMDTLSKTPALEVLTKFEMLDLKE